ncbi:hypothetical protein Bca4012_076744 [Brassica carinata]
MEDPLQEDKRKPNAEEDGDSDDGQENRRWFSVDCVGFLWISVEFVEFVGF